jgi:hypothetical protein
MQDIEAEDHILGPLSLRQFIFALVAVFCFYMCFIGIAKHIIVLWALFSLPGLFFGFFAFPWGRDQPTEIWALAKLRFLFKPRRRIWDQSGVKELVTITAPKHIEPVLTDGLSQNEVKSRLRALANTLDSRGWAVKGVDLNAYSNPDPLATLNTDRLITMDSMPHQVPNYDVHPSDDMLDETSNPVAQQFDQMIAQSEATHRQSLISQLQDNTPAPSRQPAAGGGAAQPADYWFMSPAAAAAPRPGKAAFAPPQVQLPVNDSVLAAAAALPDEEALASQLKANNSSKQIANTHLRTIQPLGSQPPMPQPAAASPAPTPSPAPPDPAILSLANNNDLNVATLAREAHKAKHDEPPQSDEVVISLH